MGRLDTLSIDVPADVLACAQSAVASGDYASMDELVGVALQQWTMRREADIAKLRAMIDEGIASGFEPWEGVDGIIAEGRRKLAGRQA